MLPFCKMGILANVWSVCCAAQNLLSGNREWYSCPHIGCDCSNKLDCGTYEAYSGVCDVQEPLLLALTRTSQRFSKNQSSLVGHQCLVTVRCSTIKRIMTRGESFLFWYWRVAQTWSETWSDPSCGCVSNIGSQHGASSGCELVLQHTYFPQGCDYVKQGCCVNDEEAKTER